MRYVVQFDASDLATQVRGIMAKLLICGMPSRDEIGSELNLTPRTLQRRLLKQDSALLCTLMCNSCLQAVGHYLSSCWLVTSSRLTKPLTQ